MMSNIRALGRFRLAALATILLLVMVLAAGSLFAANERENPDIQPVGESVQLEGIDPGLDAKPPTADKVEPPAVVIETEPGDGADPGAGQEIRRRPEGSEALCLAWLADQSRRDGAVLDAGRPGRRRNRRGEWILYQAVATGT